MSKGKETLEELLSDPIIRLLMERDRVRPEEVRMLLRKAARNAPPSLAPHVIDNRGCAPSLAPERTATGPHRRTVRPG